MTNALPQALTSRAYEAIAKATAYLRGRQSYNGGFCFYKFEYLDEPNLRDTYHAVAALTLLGAEVPRPDEVAQYLDSAEAYGIGGLFFYAFALERLGRSSLIDAPRLARILALPIKQRESTGGTTTSTWLENSLKTLQLKHRFGNLPDGVELASIITGLKHQGGYGDTPNLWDTQSSLSILALLREHMVSQEDTRAFVDSLQRPSIGFTPTRDSLYTNLEVIIAGTRCCQMLDLPIRYPADILAFVLGCQTTRGGFARAPVALADIELTHQSLEIIGHVEPDLLRP